MSAPGSVSGAGTVDVPPTPRKGQLMGYYADQVSGQPFTITNPGAVLAHLATTETEHGHAWVYPISYYRIDGMTDTDLLDRYVSEFGFDATSGENGVTIHAWNGEKWSRSAGMFFHAFTMGTTELFSWFFRGEDGEEWAEINGPDGFREADVTVTLTVEGV